MKSKCLWLVYYLTICWIFFSHLTVWTARPTLRAVLQKTDCPLLMEMPISVVVVVVLNTLWNSYLNQATKNVYIIIFVFAKFSYPQRNPVMKIFKTKKKSLYYLGNFNSPLPLQPLWPGLWPGLRSNVIVCASFWSVSLISVVQVIRREQPISWAPLYN